MEVGTQDQQDVERQEIFPVVFMGSGNLRLVRVPVRKVLVHMAESLTEGLDYQFQPTGPGGKQGRLEITQERIALDHDFFLRNDPDYDKEKGPLTLEWIRNRPMFGERFWELPAVEPDPQETLEMIAAASARGDESALVAIYEQEKRTYGRSQILKPIEFGLQALEERRASEEQPKEGASAAAGAFRPPEQE